MGIKQLKSVTPGSRFASRSDFSELTTRTPEKGLTRALKKSGGRNNTGRITIRRRGGGHKRRYRIIDFKRDKFEIPGIYAYWCTPHKGMGMIGFVIVGNDKSNLDSIKKLKFMGKSKKIALELIASL